jgi:hypothetical protein
MLPRNVANDLSAQIRDRGENAAAEIVPVDSAKPQFDLVQPRRIRGREMQRMVSSMFMRVNAKCAHQVHPPSEAGRRLQQPVSRASCFCSSCCTCRAGTGLPAAACRAPRRRRRPRHTCNCLTAYVLRSVKAGSYGRPAGIRARCGLIQVLQCGAAPSSVTGWLRTLTSGPYTTAIRHQAIRRVGSA